VDSSEATEDSATAKAEPEEKQPFPVPPAGFVSKAGGANIAVCSMPEMPAAIKAARDSGLTPLVIDRSESKLVDTFFGYSARLLDAKKLGLDASIRKQPLVEVMEAFRDQLATALQFGDTLVIACQNSVCDFVGKFNDTKAIEAGFDSAGKPFPASTSETKSLFPIEILENSGLNFVKKENEAKAEAVFREAQLASGLAIIKAKLDDDGKHESGFNVVVTTHFNYEDLDEFMFNGDYGLPPGKFQPIWIKHEDGTPAAS